MTEKKTEDKSAATEKKVAEKKANTKKPTAKKTVKTETAKAKKAAAEKAEAVKQTAAAKAEEAKKTAAEVAEATAATVEETKESIVDKAKKAYNDVPTDEFQAKADEVSKKAAETAKKASEAVKSGFADHGIDTDKLGSALKKDAKSAATTIIGGAKFASEKFGELLGNLHEKLEDKPNQPGDKGDADEGE